MSEDVIAAAAAALEAGEPRQALVQLRPAFSYPGPEDPSVLLAGLKVMVGVGEAMGDPELPQRIEACLSSPEDADAFYEVGYQMIEVGLEAYAAAVLEHGLRLAPENLSILTELAAALERSLEFEAVRSLLQSRPILLERDFLPNYLLAFNSLMCGDLDEPAELLPELLKRAGDNEKYQFMVARIETSLARAEAIRAVSSLDKADLRGWHWVITGGLLTHRSPHGLDAGMNGRYAWTQGSTSLARLGIERLAILLKEWELDLPRVVALPERGAEILGHALAERLSLPLEPYTDGGVEGPALIVAHDLGRIDGPVLKTLVTRRPDQLLWVHATCWTEHFPVAPDATTLLYQQLIPFFEGHMVVNPETKSVGRGEPDERSPAEIAADVLVAPEDSLTDGPADLAHLQAIAQAIGAEHIHHGGRREAMWFGSPVSSNRFTP